ncbi:ATP-dependent DNA helicase RecG [Clostridium aminobutyricum]|uniref:ATP-dependent DNA helicase RecG n=1 Tax=Clostridium aminobutyricum TaxID=33953 RepID=A0A939II06_CLOAM|nr:ATP-dependent DNA helicase RecG [Clostridium aminobutyricum]MBN7772571.1 ATP-dependent DNA helicase RecG [Clostridium aminobutyricum]
MNLNDPISSIKGIGSKKADVLKSMGIETIEDFFYVYPRDYQDRRELKKVNELLDGSVSLVKGKIVLKVKNGSPYSRKQTLKVLVTDETGGMEVVFFNPKFIVNRLEMDAEYVFYGRVSIEFGKIKMIHPEFVKSGANNTQGIIPIYPLKAGISQSEMQKWQHIAAGLLEELKEPLTKAIIDKNNLCDIQYAIRHIHRPQDKNTLKAAKYRLIFDELLFLQIGLFSIKNKVLSNQAGICFDKNVQEKIFMEQLPYTLTGAQQRVIAEIMRDMESEKGMNRLVQGDVGSGKTAIAEIALYKAVKSGFQGVMMAPTELLAKQHFEGFVHEFDKHGITVGFLSGSMSAKEKHQTLEKLAEGSIDILVGTHALIQPNVVFKNLGLVITDEQHRFGVNQRNLLAEKGQTPDILIMTATPIPRTLAVILYGDLDISVIDELPPGRQQIITRAAESSGREKAYAFIRNEIENGRQAYVVAPLISESESLENVISAEELYQELKKKFNTIEVSLLHGEMKQAEKDEIMTRFYNNEIKILVSTVVIEVGINVPNATIMLIENAERFGLAQLHQLRGRVGRGKHQSYCLLISNGKNPIAKERIHTMVSTSDGFIIAEKDLELRGPGEFFGTKQHGLPDLKLADLVKHAKILHRAREEAKTILEEDPQISLSEHACLREKTLKLFSEESILSI